MPDSLQTPEMMNSTIRKTTVAVGSKRLEGILRVPPQSAGLVVFAHGAGSSHMSPRNNMVAEELAKRGIATLLFDLLTEGESTDRRNVFDIPLLSRRLIEAIAWLRHQPGLPAAPIGLFGSSTGAAAALVAAATAPTEICAVVSRGGRPDMACEALHHVKAPVLLVVGGADEQVLDLNDWAAGQLTCQHSLKIIPGATHLFAEPGALEQVVALAVDWFEANCSSLARAS